MAGVTVTIDQSVKDDLDARPGRSKLDREAAARPRLQLHIALFQLMNDMAASGGPPHLRADVLEEERHVLNAYPPKSLAALLTNAERPVTVSPTSRHAARNGEGYLTAFRFPRIGWSVLAGYVSPRPKPALVMLRVMPIAACATALEGAEADPAEFDRLYAAAVAVADAAA